MFSCTLIYTKLTASAWIQAPNEDGLPWRWLVYNLSIWQFTISEALPCGLNNMYQLYNTKKPKKPFGGTIWKAPNKQGYRMGSLCSLYYCILSTKSSWRQKRNHIKRKKLASIGCSICVQSGTFSAGLSHSNWIFQNKQTSMPLQNCQQVIYVNIRTLEPAKCFSFHVTDASQHPRTQQKLQESGTVGKEMLLFHIISKYVTGVQIGNAALSTSCLR